jgi:endonuclease G
LYTQNFDTLGIPATATTSSPLPADFRVDALTTVGKVGTFSAAVTTTARAGGANLATNAANGIYNFGAGTATLGGSDRAVGFLASGTSTTSGNVYAHLVNSTGGNFSGLQVSYNVEKYRKGSNAAGFRIQMFYSTDGNTWTSAGNNFLTSFAADADNTGFATAPGPTVNINQTLSAPIPSGSDFYLAWNYSVTSGSTVTNAQALAVDDISILGIPGSSEPATNPTGFGIASPSGVLAGNQTLITVTVTPGSNPTSSGVNVSGNLSSIGGSATQQFFDDGTNGDAVAGNNIFSYNATVSIATTPGLKTIPFSITDAQSRSGSGNVSLTASTGFRDPVEHMVMGNPSGALTHEGVPLNYLMMKPQYALSYNNEKGTPNWTNWHLDSTWTTDFADRQDDFRVDNTLPSTFKRVSNGFQFGTYGFQRGHMCPSADRTSSDDDNSATFLMTNMVPQAPGNNEGPWRFMEDYIRDQLNETNELYIVSGGAGVGGQSSTGHWNSIIDTAGNTVTVPEVTWKVVMVLPNLTGDDVSRVSTSTRTFGVIMPNDDSIEHDQWQKYLATVDQVEALTGYDFYSNVPTLVQDVIEARLDPEINSAPVTSDLTKTTVRDQAVAITLSADDFNINNILNYTIVNGPLYGSLSGSNENRTYSPNPSYIGPDSFTYKANDGALDSNVSTVTIMVNGPSLLQFSAATYSIGESGGSATITVNRTGSSVGAVSVNFASANGTATGAVSCATIVDYLGTSGTLSWADGESGSKTFAVAICNDSLNEEDETITLALSNPTGGATLGTPTATTLTVVNDDAPMLLIEENTQHAVALDAVTQTRDPFSLTNPFNMSTDQRRRISLFVWRLGLLPGDTASVVTVRAEDDQGRVYPLTVEYVGAITGPSDVTQVVVVLPDAVIGAPRDLWVTVSLRGPGSGRALIKIAAP